MDIEEIVSKLNNKMTREEVAKSIGISGSTITRWLRDAGYKYDNSAKQYYVASSTTNEPTNVTTIEPKKKTTIQLEIEPTKEYSNIVRKRASFDIDVKLLKELKIYAIQRDQNVYEIVETAIRQYLKG